MTDIARNDPCPCGSGKKYKKCCLEKETRIKSSPEGRLREKLMTSLMEFIHKRAYEEEVEEAFYVFWGEEIEELPDDIANDLVFEERAEVAFHEWLIHDYITSSGKTFLDLYLEKKGKDLSLEEITHLKKSMETYLGLYQIEEVFPEKGFVFHDLFTGARIRIKERLATRCLVKWDLLAARLIQLDGDNQLSGGVIPLPLEGKENIIQFMKKAFAAWKKGRKEASFTQFLKSCGYLFNHIHREVAANFSFPQLVTPEGDPIVFSKAYYQVLDFNRVIQGLRHIPNIEEERDGSFVWFEEVGDETIRGLGNISVAKERLVLECISAKRLERGKKLLAQQIGPFLRYKTDTFQDPWQAVREYRKRPEKDKVKEEIPREVQEGIIKGFLDTHYREWLDTPLPALAGKTPRAAVKTKIGRQQVTGLLQEMENSEERQKLTRGYGYDFSWLWEELGLR